MKFYFILFLSMVCLTLSAQSECSDYYPFQQGTETELTTYDKKGKVAAVVNYKVLEVSGGSVTMQSQVLDSEGEEIAQSEYEMKCDDDGILIDIQALYSPSLMSQYENMETSISGSELSLPNDLEEGDELEDAEMYITVSMGGIDMNVDVSMTDRKVIGKEQVTVPAGTFDCIVIEYTSSIKMGLEKKGSAKQWIAKGVGLVKQEDYNKRGKVTSSTELTKFQP
ncbi:DUF3108 domain-containing protein [Portibacter marinus]|uniref:DUF3108 domain-containing protein n=1 Tax=Portibacter marinus TaxID=2898660 RepID=UPI001F2ED92F|nr:DUF3108 domain-containing protein [Portibacter marinus]